MALLRTVILAYQQRLLLKEDGGYIVTAYDNNRIYLYDNQFTELRVVNLAYGPYGILKEDGGYIVADYINSKIHWYDNQF